MAPISRELLEASPDKTIIIDNGAIRVRLLNTEALPYLGCVAEKNGPREALLIDFAQKRKDLRYINGNNMAVIGDDEFWATPTDAGGDTVMEEDDDEKENMMLDLTTEGDPLEIKFEAVDEMRKKVRASRYTQAGIGIEVRFPIECNPLTAVQADTWLKKLTFESHKWLDSHLNNTWILIANDGDDGRKIMITGIKKKNERVMVSLFGKGGIAFKNIAASLARVSNLSSRKYVYADYDVFKRLFLYNQPAIDPNSAFFRIHVEWPVSGNVKWLSTPPVDTPMTITFSPGWMDSRIGMLERTSEIEFLLVLSDWLFQGKTQWPSKDLDPVIVDEVASLVRSTSLVNETDKNDAIAEDFTFKLWIILRKCSSFVTLQSCLDLVLKSIRGGEITALVRNENSSTIAHMLRSSEKKGYPIGRLETLTCVELLLELGVDYMKCIMTEDFLSKGFIQTIADLNNVFVDASVPIEERARALLPIHLAYQSVNCLQTYIKNTSHELINLTRRALQKFCSSKAVPLHSEQLIFDVKGSVYDWVFCDTTLSDWCLHRTTHCGKEKEPRVEHYFHFSSRVEFQHIANRLYIPRGDDEPKQSNLAAMTSEKIEESFKAKADEYCAKKNFYCAATIISHVPM